MADTFFLRNKENSKFISSFSHYGYGCLSTTFTLNKNKALKFDKFLIEDICNNEVFNIEDYKIEKIDNIFIDKDYFNWRNRK